MKAVLGALACREARARFDDDLDAALDLAVRHYEGRLSDRLLPPPPELPEPLDPPLVEAEIDLAPEHAAVLEAEASRLGLEPRLFANHALLLYLADLDRRRDGLRRCDGRKRRRSPLER